MINKHLPTRKPVQNDARHALCQPDELGYVGFMIVH
jgi:hypothetical protein